MSKISKQSKGLENLKVITNLKYMNNLIVQVLLFISSTCSRNSTSSTLQLWKLCKIRKSVRIAHLGLSVRSSHKGYKGHSSHEGCEGHSCRIYTLSPIFALRLAVMSL